MSSALVLKREDIAALEVVADPKAQLTHGLNTDYVDLKWILAQKPDELTQLLEQSRQRSSVQRDRSVASSSEDPDAKPKKLPASSSSRQRLESHLRSSRSGVTAVPLPSAPETLHISKESIVTSRLEDGHCNADQSCATPGADGQAMQHDSRQLVVVGDSSSMDVCSHSPGAEESASNGRRGKRGLRNILSLDCHQCAPKNRRVPLIDSPRSVFLILSHGHHVEELCQVDPQSYYNEALRTGVPFEMVNLRIAAENKRRFQRYQSLSQLYIKFSARVSSEEVVSAIQQHKYGAEIEALRNKLTVLQAPRFTYHGSEDLSLLDEDCLKVLEASRAKTIEEIKRELELNERKLRQTIDREQRALADASGAEEERRAIELREKDRRDRSLQIQKRTEIFRERIERIRQEQDNEVEELRRQVELKERENEEFKKEQDTMRRAQSEAAAEEQSRKRQIIKQTVEEREAERRDAMLRRSEFMSKLHHRDQERKQEHRQKQQSELREINDGRARAIRQLASMQLEEKRLKCETAVERSNQRAEEFKKTRSMRLEARKKLMEERAERSAQSRKMAEEKHEKKAKELEEEYQKKQQYIEEMTDEHKRQLTLQKELSKQSRIVQLEEQQRSQSVNLFRQIGYLADAEAKAQWLERENAKRVLLANQVRQEREALVRAKEIILKKAEVDEIERRKREAYFIMNKKKDGSDNSVEGLTTTGGTTDSGERSASAPLELCSNSECREQQHSST